jgi:DNA-directed RNA polymerase specialized sigma24 family protein
MSQPLSNLLVHLRRVALAPAKNRGTDAELLLLFVKHRDMLAFELLFWRHGPMVWSVCRRLLGNSPDAEDAFQATFLVLARKARSVGDGASLSGWLHRVARHTSLNARTGG